jgi:hypothetical protein
MHLLHLLLRRHIVSAASHPAVVPMSLVMMMMSMRLLLEFLPSAPTLPHFFEL